MLVICQTHRCASQPSWRIRFWRSSEAAAGPDIAAAKDADDAVAQAWAAYRGELPFALITSVAAADSDGWSKIRGYSYDVPPNLKRAVGANALWANGAWTVVLFDAAHAVAEKRGAQIGLMLGKLLPKGGARESFAGRPAHELDRARVEALLRFVEVPGVYGLEFVVGEKAGKRTLTTRDGQHEYVFVEAG